MQVSVLQKTHYNSKIKWKENSNQFETQTERLNFEELVQQCLSAFPIYIILQGLLVI